MATGKLEDPRVLELARKSVIMSMQRMVHPRTPFSTRIHSAFSARGLPVTSRFLDFVLDDLVSLNIVAKSGSMYMSIMTADDLHVFLSAPGFVETISRRAIMKYFSRSVPSLEEDGLTLRRSGEEGSYSYEITHKAPDESEPESPESDETVPDWISIPGLDAYVRKHEAAMAGARVKPELMLVTKYIDSDLNSRIDIKIPILMVPDLGCFVNVSVKAGDIHASWSPVMYGRLPDPILNDYVKGRNSDRFVLKNGQGKIVRRAPVQEILDLLTEGAYSDMKKRLTGEVVLAASEKLKELNVTATEKTDSAPVMITEESNPDPIPRVVEDFPLPEPEDEKEEEEMTPLTRQSWMDFVTEEQLKSLRQAQEVVVKLMDGHGMSRSEMFGKDPIGWQARFCYKLKAEGILTCVGSNKWARWSATPEGLERLSSIEQLIPFVFSPTEIARYRSFLEHGMDDKVPIHVQEDDDSDDLDEDVSPNTEIVRVEAEAEISSPTDLEARVNELEDLVQQQNAMIHNLTKQMSVMIGHWQDIKKKIGDL